MSRERIIELTNTILHHNNAYYTNNEPEISDFEYDQLYLELKDLETKYPEHVQKNSPLNKVGAALKDVEKSIKHEYQMFSLDNSYSMAEIDGFFERAKRILNVAFTYVVEPKIDGLAVSIIYNNGEFVKIATRGDGLIGEDVSRNASMIVDIPKSINYKGKLNLRGEVYMSIKSFEELNKLRADDELPILANARNAAAGSLKLLDMQEAKSRKLNLNIYGVDTELHGTHLDNINFCKAEGFTTVDSVFCNDLIEVKTAIDNIEKGRFSVDYDIDGAVIKINEKSIQSELGYTAKFPRWAVAYKYAAVQAKTRINSVSFQVGRTGAVTPVAELEAVSLSGSVVSRATLHNEDEIRRLDIKVRDIVVIEKAGEVIPKVVSVDISSRGSNVEEIEFPKLCPVCNSTLEKIEDEARYYCKNKNCTAIIQGSIEHFASKNAMDIKGMGEKVVAELLSAGLIKSYVDIYLLKPEQLKERSGWGELSADNLIKAIELSKEQPFERVLFALGVRHVGKESAKLLVQHYKNIDELKSASINDLQQVNGIGMEIASATKKTFSDNDFLTMIDRLKSYGLNFESKVSTSATGVLSGATFLITGVLDKPRKFYEDLIISHGGVVLSGISKKLEYLVVGQDAGSKLDKAKKNGSSIITKDDLIKMIS